MYVDIIYIVAHSCCGEVLYFTQDVMKDICLSIVQYSEWWSLIIKLSMTEHWASSQQEDAIISTLSISENFVLLLMK